MKKCIIAGSVGSQSLKTLKKTHGVLYIAADGGYDGMKEAGITPDILLGDFDSLGNETEVPEGTEIKKYPVEKDDTDTLIAVKTALTHGCEEITLYGCLGGPRFDHTVATLQTLTFAAERGAKITAVGDGDGRPFYVTALHNSSLELPETLEGTFSVMCAGESCEGVSIENAKYCLVDATVTPSFPIGVSNSFIKGKRARVAVKKGTLWIIY